MTTGAAFAAVLNEFEARTDEFTELDIFGKLAALASSIDGSAKGEDFQSELAAFRVTEHRDWKSDEEFHLEYETLSERLLNYWERRAIESTHPFMKWRYSALAIQARGQLKLHHQCGNATNCYRPSCDYGQVTVWGF